MPTSVRPRRSLAFPIVLNRPKTSNECPCKRLAEAIAASNAREEKEARVIERLQAGESLFDIYGYQAKLDALGCTQE